MSGRGYVPFCKKNLQSYFSFTQTSLLNKKLKKEKIATSIPSLLVGDSQRPRGHGSGERLPNTAPTHLPSTAQPCAGSGADYDQSARRESRSSPSMVDTRRRRATSRSAGSEEAAPAICGGRRGRTSGGRAGGRSRDDALPPPAHPPHRPEGAARDASQAGQEQGGHHPPSTRRSSPWPPRGGRGRGGAARAGRPEAVELGHGPFFSFC